MSSTDIGIRPRRAYCDLRNPLKVWPYNWASLGFFLTAYGLMVGAWTIAGLAVTRWLEPSRLGRNELNLNRWFEVRRTESLDTVAHVGSVPSDTFVTIGLMALLLVLFPLVWRRWHDWAFLLGALVLEVAVYVTSNLIVGRPRPPVERLEEIVTNSFPSGHVAAAVALYFGVGIVVFWHTTDTRIRAAAVIIGAVVPVIVALSRLYLGVHYLSDVIAGAALGVAAVLVSLAIARHGLRNEVAETPGVEPPHAAWLDVSHLNDNERR